MFLRRCILMICAASATLATIHARPAISRPVDPSQLNGLQWRLVGPFRGGWGTMAAGIADQPDTFYFGAAGGGHRLGPHRLHPASRHFRRRR